MLIVSGADLLDGTPIFDIKPYLPYADAIPDAVGGFASSAPAEKLSVQLPSSMLEQIPPQKRAALRELLALDPRPSYQEQPDRVYGMRFGGFQIRFRVDGSELTVLSVEPD